MKDVIKLILFAGFAGGLALSANAQVFPGSISETFVESGSGGLNNSDYSDPGAGWPNSWFDGENIKSTAAGVTSGIWTRWNSNAAEGSFFEVSPVLPEAGGTYEVYVTVPTHDWVPEQGQLISEIEVTGGQGLPLDTDGFSKVASDTWYLIGTLTLDTGVDNPTIRFNETTYSHLSGEGTIVMFADTIAFSQVPEPSTYASIFGGLALLAAFVYRRRLAVTK